MVFGAAGRTGARVVEELRRRGSAVRPTRRRRDPSHDDGAIEVDVLDRARVRAALEGAAGVIWTVAPSSTRDRALLDAVEHRALADLVVDAREAGVRRLIVCSSQSTEAPQAVPFLAPILAAKALGEAAVAASGLDWTLVRPGGLRDDLGRSSVRLSKEPLPIGFVSRDDVATVLVECLARPRTIGCRLDLVSDPSGHPAESDAAWP